MVTLGLRAAGTAQRNGFTAVRKMPARFSLRARMYLWFMNNSEGA
jgi:hypothetical protein